MVTAVERRPLLDKPGLAAYLGVSVRTVRRSVEERRIPFVKVGGLIRFNPDAIDAWLAEHEIPPQDPPLRSSPATRPVRRKR